MSVSNLTNGCKKATDPHYLVPLSRPQLIEVVLALTMHVEQLNNYYAYRPTKAHQITLLAANNALDVVRHVLSRAPE